MLAIYKKELRTYFTGIMGYLFIAFFLLVAGIYTVGYCVSGGTPDFEYVCGTMAFVFSVLGPFLTMRIMAEEKKQKTDQLLLTAPVSVFEIVFAKYLAMISFMAIPILVMCLYPLILSAFGQIPMAASYGSLLCLFLLGAALLAIGMFISSLTENQIVAAVVTFAVFLIAYLLSSLVTLISTSALASLAGFAIAAILLGIIIRLMTGSTPLAAIVALICMATLVVLYLVNPTLLAGTFTKALGTLAVFDPLDSFAYYSIIDLTAIVYYVSIAALFVFFTVQVIEKGRWS